MKKESLQRIILMKSGSYCGYGLEEIIEIKQKEEKEIGKFFWGYSGVFCRPDLIKAFASSAKQNKKKVFVLFTETKSSYKTDGEGKFAEFSEDKLKWSPLPKEVLLVGNTKKPHFAICGKNLKKADLKIDLSQYQVFLKSGLFLELNKNLADYLKYRVDKACGIYSPKKTSENKIIKIDYVCELAEPYCVYIK